MGHPIEDSAIFGLEVFEATTYKNRVDDWVLQLHHLGEIRSILEQEVAVKLATEQKNWQRLSIVSVDATKFFECGADGNGTGKDVGVRHADIKSCFATLTMPANENSI